ncbi:MAG: hypothetical protein OES10_09715 [Gammaproteobacteria bacterium]|jgi:hypothetical protein|nr:hypothetical protein [Gammaproteobacteria bacterium]
MIRPALVQGAGIAARKAANDTEGRHLCETGPILATAAARETLLVIDFPASGSDMI